MGWIVGGKANRDLIPHDDSDFESLHLSAQFCADGDPILQKDLIVPSAGSVGNFAFKPNEIIFRHESITSDFHDRRHRDRHVHHRRRRSRRHRRDFREEPSA